MYPRLDHTPIRRPSAARAARFYGTCRAACVVAVAVLAAGCALLFPPPPGIGGPVPWKDVPGWSNDHHAEAWPALLQSCRRLAETPPWQAICVAAQALPDPDDEQARAFFERWFVAHRAAGERGRRDGLITGYYEPLLAASRERTARFRYPIYGQPKDLLVVDLGALYPELAGKRVRGRLQGRRVVPYLSRQDIDSPQHPLAGNEIAWVDDPVGLFFLHIQGSGRLRLPDGRTLAIGYADQNGHPYTAIGRVLVDMGELAPDDVNLFTIRDWLRRNPQRAGDVLARNASYVFFALRKDPAGAATGALGVPLTAERSIAVDPAAIPLGSPVWLDTTLPGKGGAAYRRLVFAQDTGGAIKGYVRTDVFFGEGERAERLAGTMKQTGRLFVLLPAGTPNAGVASRSR